MRTLLRFKVVPSATLSGVRRELMELSHPTSSISSRLTPSLRARTDLSPEAREIAQTLVLTSRKAAAYAVDDAAGHEGLALKSGDYDHPSAPIRRFSDMYNRVLLESYLEGGDPAATHAAVLKDLQALGFATFDEYLEHLNGRALAARQMDYEVDEFMSVYELAKPANRGKTFRGLVRQKRAGREPFVVIALEGSAATVTVTGPEAADLKLLEPVSVEVRGADIETRRVDFILSREPGTKLSQDVRGGARHAP